MDYFEKKQWIRIAVCAVLVVFAVLALTGVFGGKGPLLYDPAAKSVADGATEADITEQGFGGEITVHAGLEGNTVRSLSIDTPNETEGLGKRASEAEFTDQFIGKSGPFTFGEDGIEALSGATVTSTAALKAINRAITGEEPAAEQESSGNGGDLLSQIALSMGNEENNSYVTDYLKQDPYLVNIYEGYGFAKDYGSARGHSYTLEDVQKTQRPHAKANCLTCKTPDMHKMIEEQGVSVYSMPFDEVMAQTTNTVSCYTCHGGDDGNNGQMAVTHQYVNEALGENVSQIMAASLACGQCHIEYYFTPEDSEAMMPYHSVEEMTPEAILAYYDEMGFYDWEQPGTGTKMLKAQHPELETYLQGRHASMLSCADCHMPVKTTENGAEYHDHHLVSPLNSETLLSKCAECHGSGEAISARVREIQAKVTGRETEVGNRLSALKDTITSAAEAGIMNEEELDAVRKLHREAQWYFDFCYVENSEGAHNSSLAMNCLNTSDEKITEALGLLAAAGAEVKETAALAAQEEEVSPDGSVTEQGFGGDVTVHAEFNEDGTIRSLTIDTPNETPGLGQRASEEEFTVQFIGKSGPFAYGEDGIEALSGATVTSTAVLKAINNALPGGEASAEEPEAEPAEGSATETEEAPGTELETGEETKEESKAAETNGQTYGVYRSTKQNDFSTITVTAFTKNGTLTNVKITSEGDEGKDLLTDEIRNEWAEAILESGSASPDTITGATLKFSAGSVQEAMAEILTNMGEEAAEAPTELPEEEPAEARDAEPQTGEAENKEDKAGGTNGQAYGVYRSTKQNDFSKVTVTVSTKNGTLKDVKITSEGDEGKDLLTDAIRNEWAEAILESGSASPDAITGATLKFSAGSVQEAMTEILAAINGETMEESAEEPGEETTEEAAEASAEETAEEPAEEPAAESAADAPAERVIPAYAGYRADADNSFSRITVIASAVKGQLTAVKILSGGEEGKDLLTDEIRKEWADAILNSGSASPDAITGATLQFSAGSVREAMAEILQKMNGNGEPADEPAEEPDETPAEETEETPAEASADAAAEEAQKTPPAFAGYRAEAENAFSRITVIAFARNSVLASVKILSEGEEGKDLLTDEMKAGWAQAIVESGSASPDAVTGATLTFSAGSVQEAMAEILNKIAGR